LYGWIEAEELELEAISEAILSFINLFSIKDSLNINLVNVTNDISTLVFNKFSFKFLFSFKNRKELKNALEVERLRLTNEISSLETIIKYAAHSLSSYIEKIKPIKHKEYLKAIRTCAIINKNNLRMVNNTIISIKI